MGRQDRGGSTNRVPRDLLDSGNGGWQWEREKRILWIDIAITKAEQLAEVQDLAKLHQPCIILLRVDQVIKTHYAGAYTNGVYCTSSISGFVYDLMLGSIQA